MIQAFGDDDSLVGVLTVDRERDVSVRPILPELFIDQQEWTVDEKKGGFFTIHISLGGSTDYLTCMPEGHLAVVDELYPIVSATGMYLKLRHYQKATKLEKISHLFWQNSCFYLVASKQMGDFFKFLWPSQKT